MTNSLVPGQSPPKSALIDVNKLISAYYSEIPDPAIASQKVSFGTSGHRGTSLDGSFNENHILAITEALCLYRRQNRIDGPLFLGIDTHALSVPALKTALEVLAANNVNVMLAEHDEYTPTPVISHAILTYNRDRAEHLADGIIITPSHNPPQDGGFKYNPPNGGPADTNVTDWIQRKANELLNGHLGEIKRVPYEKALKAATTHRHNYIDSYVNDLSNVIDMEVIRYSNISIGVDPMGGAGVHYWRKIAARYDLNLKVVSETIDPQFAFMSLDWDGQIRMDPSSSFAMQRLIKLKNNFDVAFGCDTDHDRHGIITKTCGLLKANHYLSAAVYYLINNRPIWKKNAGIGKTVVSTLMIDRIAKNHHKPLFEVPVGFKWFVDGLIDGSLSFVCEESAGATFARLNGKVFTTDKDGITASLLAAEMTARLNADPGQIYKNLTDKYGVFYTDRVEAKASRDEKERLKNIAPQAIKIDELGGEKITSILTKAPGNNAPIGGIKITSENGWFAARPSGTEDIYKIYGESTKSNEHLNKIFKDAQAIVDEAIA